MFNGKNLRKINLLVAGLSVLVFMFAFFDIQWRGATIVNTVPNIEITALAPVKAILVNLVGNQYGQLINNILCLNIVWYVIVVFPVWIWNWVREVIHID